MLVDALRSGEFRQARQALRRDGGYCCLGVATEIALRNGLEISDDEGYGFPWNQNHQIMCTPVAQWYGLGQNPLLRGTTASGKPYATEATSWNDDDNATFLEIADAFERTYLQADETDAA